MLELHSEVAEREVGNDVKALPRLAERATAECG